MVPLLAMLLLIMPAATIAAEAEPPARSVRAVTYNVLHGGVASGFWLDGSRLDIRLEAVVRELQALQPDIVALQEVSQSRQYGDVPSYLARRLGMQVAFAPATDRLFGVRPLDALLVGLLGFQEGSAILSRFPIRSATLYDLPRCVRRLDPRIVQHAVVETPWGSLSVFSVHTARHDDCQLQRVAEIVREHPAGSPALVMGDFNAEESSSAISALRLQAGFLDAFRRAHPSDPGFTVLQRITALAPTVFRRVDYIFVVNAQPTDNMVRSSRVVLDHPHRDPTGGVVWPSDHYGVFAEIALPHAPPLP